MIDFHVDCIPPKTTSQMKRAVRTGTGIRFFKGKKQAAAEQTLEAVLLPHRPSRPVAGIVRLTISVTWPWRQKDTNTKARAAMAKQLGRIPNGSKPDIDNYVKGLIDKLVTLRFIERDELVVDLRARKFFGERPGIQIEVEPVTMDVGGVAAGADNSFPDNPQG